MDYFYIMLDRVGYFEPSERFEHPSHARDAAADSIVTLKKLAPTVTEGIYALVMSITSCGVRVLPEHSIFQDEAAEL